MKAIILMDYINEIVHEDGKLAAKGYADFIERNDTLSNVRGALERARAQGYRVVHVGLAFDEDYGNQPKGSPLFGKAHEFGILAEGSWGARFHDSIDVRTEDQVFVKDRVSPFYNTGLDDFLRQEDISEVYLCGVATDLVVESGARDAHDRDYHVNVLSDCCAAASDQDHENSLKTMQKIASLISYKQI